MRRNTPAILLAAAIAAGCGSDSPTAPAPQSLAVHFDSLWQQAIVANDTLRQIAMQFIAIPLAFGVAPHQVSITADGKAASFSAISYAFIDIDYGGQPVDSSFYFAAWADANASRVILTEELAVERQFAAGYLDGATEELANSGTIADTALSPSGRCSALDLASVYYEAEYTTCSRSVQVSSFDMQLTPYKHGAAGGPTVAEIKLGAVHLPAVRLLQHF